MYAKLKRELRAAECEEKIYYCEPEQGVFFDKEEDMDDEERIIESFLSIWTSSYQHEGGVTKESNGDPYVFKSDVLCTTAGDEQPWEDVFMHVNEEMKLLEEMSEMEEFLVEHVFVGLENGHPLEAAIEDEDNAEVIQEYEAVRNAEVLQEYDVVRNAEDGVRKNSLEERKSPLTICINKSNLKFVEEDKEEMVDLVIELEFLEEWQAHDMGNERCLKYVLVVFVDLYEELKFLEMKIMDQQMHIQHVKSELKMENVALKESIDVKYDQLSIRQMYEPKEDIQQQVRDGSNKLQQ